MARTVLIVPELLSPPGEEPSLRASLPGIERLAEGGELFKIAPLPPVATPEALYVGLPPDEGQLAPGPLTVAALGADPPERSTHFQLTLMSLLNGRPALVDSVPTGEDVAPILAAMKKLDTRILTTLAGEGLDHALVWEGLGDLCTRSPDEAATRPLREVLPQGDAETMLRRFIDDSVNLLSELAANERRRDEGRPTLDLLWPWGQGVRLPVPNLALRRGEVVTVESASLRLAGLTRLVGYRHGHLRAFGPGLGAGLSAAASRLAGLDPAIFVLETFANLRAMERVEEIQWLLRELDRSVVEPLVDAPPLGRVTLLAPSAHGPGLGAEFEQGSKRRGAVPFDERALDEPSLSTRDLWRAVRSALRPLGA